MTLRRARPYWAGNKSAETTYENAFVAYALRALPGLTPPASVIRVYNGTDEMDFGLDGGVLDESGISSFCGANIGRAVKLYNHGSGTDLDVQQLTDANRPIIYDGSSFFTINGKHYLDFSGGDKTLESRTLDIVMDETLTDKNNMHTVTFESQGVESIEGVFEENRSGSGNNNRNVVYSETNSSTKRLYNYAPDGTARFIDLLAQSSINTIFNASVSKNSTSIKSYLDGTEQGEVVTSVTFSNSTLLRLGKQNIGPLIFNGKISEFILFDFFDSALLTEFQNEQISYFGI